MKFSDYIKDIKDVESQDLNESLNEAFNIEKEINNTKNVLKKTKVEMLDLVGDEKTLDYTIATQTGVRAHVYFDVSKSKVTNIRFEKDIIEEGGNWNSMQAFLNTIQKASAEYANLHNAITATVQLFKQLPYVGDEKEINDTIDHIYDVLSQYMNLPNAQIPHNELSIY